MSERFSQIRIPIENETSSGKLKVSDLVGLISNHPYKEAIFKEYGVKNIIEELISIDHIDLLYKRIKFLNESFKRYNISAYKKDVTIKDSAKKIKGINTKKSFIFNFNTYVDSDGVEGENLNCYALYNSKNSFLDEYDMTKYANRLYKEGMGDLAYYNIVKFQEKTEQSNKNAKHKSFRLVENKNELFVRGITSINNYFEYGVDFTFVVAMLILHKDIKNNKGNSYAISDAVISESKLNIIIANKNLKDAGDFGKASSAILISTNDLGEGSLNFTKIIKLGKNFHQGLYLFPVSEATKKNKLIINHSKGEGKALENLRELQKLLNNTDEYINDLKNVKRIKSPDELRSQILFKLSNPRSAFKKINDLQDIFKPSIENEISNFVKLLEMCNKAEELDIDYDLKDKLRYIISNIILSKKK